jgi:hypothetical protein
VGGRVAYGGARVDAGVGSRMLARGKLEAQDRDGRPSW